jgi:hypothetical protein
METTPHFRSRWTRRGFLLSGAAAGAGVVYGLDGLANQNPEEISEAEVREFVTPETQRAIDQGLAYLSRTQNRDGSFGNNSSQYFNNSVAITSLAALAFMSGGHQPGRGEFGTCVLRALQNVVSRESRDPGTLGFLHHHTLEKTLTGMYDHGFGTLFLAEVYGMVPESALQDRLKGTIESAVHLIETAQTREGGWRYEPKPVAADLSVTVCQMMALRAARNAGFAVNKKVVDQCVKYVRSCQNPDGGYSYQVAGQPGSAFARSAAGLVALYSRGIYEGKEIDRTLKYLMQYKPNLAISRREIPDMHWYYGQYYAAQAMWVAGLRYPQYWNEWFPAIRDELLSRVRNHTDGAWWDHTTCNHYATAMATIILQIPNNYLPILQK